MSSWHQAQWNGEIKNENELATGSENETGKICYMIDENDEKRPYDISLPPAVRVLWLECWKWENRLMRKKETIWEVGTFRARQDLPPNSHLRRCCGWESAFKLIGRLRKVWIWKNEGVRKKGGINEKQICHIFRRDTVGTHTAGFTVWERMSFTSWYELLAVRSI